VREVKETKRKKAEEVKKNEKKKKLPDAGRTQTHNMAERRKIQPQT